MQTDLIDADHTQDVDFERVANNTLLKSNGLGTDDL
jgi:hypothetical protein